MAWRRDGEASRIPDVDQTEGKTAARRVCSVHRLRNVMPLPLQLFMLDVFEDMSSADNDELWFVVVFFMNQVRC